MLAQTASVQGKASVRMAGVILSPVREFYAQVSGSPHYSLFQGGFTAAIVVGDRSLQGCGARIFTSSVGADLPFMVRAPIDSVLHSRTAASSVAWVA